MYRAAGLQVVPSYLPSEHQNWKRPALADWKSLQEELVPQSTFDRWYSAQGENSRRPNMGVLSGRASGNVFVIDLDEYKTPDALAWWTGILAEHNSRIEPETCQQVTGGGGRQLFFRAPGEWLAPTNKTPIGVDIRGQGGFAVLPPSQHISGTPYAWKAGCAPWECEIASAPDWLLQEVAELVERYGGDQNRQAAQSGPVVSTASPAEDFNAFGQRVDGRDHAMRDLVWAAVVNWYRECPIKPSDAESQTRSREVWAIYERKTKTRLPGDNVAGLEKEGRGPSLFAEKWRRAMAKWSTEIAEAAQRPLEETEIDQAVQAPTSDIFDTLGLADIDALPPPTWLVDGLIPESGLTFIYGKPGKGKSFVTLDLALRVAHGFDWHGKECRQGGVLYVAGEGKGGYRNRVHGWHAHHGLIADCAPFRLLPKAVNLMTPEDVAKLVRTVKAVVGDAKLVIIDTVARALPGAEENASKEMGLFVLACDTIREACGVAVIGVHHSGKDEDRGMRGSSSLEGAGDCVLHLKRKDDSSLVEVATEKQKDGEEAKPLFLKLTKVEWMDGLKQASTLVPVIAEDNSATVSAGSGWPDTSMCRRVVNAIEEAWMSGKPWSHSPQSPDRYAPKMMAQRFEIPVKIARDMLEKWLLNDVLSIEIRDAHNKTKGLKVVGLIS
jgi:hypothetical protein